MILLNFILFTVLLVLSICEDVRWWKVVDKREEGSDNAWIEECAYKYNGADHFDRFAIWTNMKNSSHYSPIHPAYQAAVHHVDVESMRHNMPVTSGGDNCKFKELDKVRNNAEVPLRERALCSFEYILNYDAKVRVQVTVNNS